MAFSIIEGDVRRADAWDGAYPNLAQEVIVNDEYHPEWQGSNIYGLARVATPDGKQHLVGTVSKAARIVDFTTGRTIYDFSAFGAAPRSGGDSYNAVAYWRGRYYFGGWVITPSPIGTSLNTADKYTYLISTTDLVDWQIHIQDKSTGPLAWQAEISDLIPTNDALYVLRGDTDGGGTGSGLWAWDGVAATKVHSLAAIKGGLNLDKVWWATRNSSSLQVYDVRTKTLGTAVDLSAADCRAGGTAAWATVYQGQNVSLQGQVHAFCENGFVKVKQDGTSANFVPCLMSAVSNGKRALGWRTQIAHAAGGVVVAANVADPAAFDTTAATQSILLWIGPSGQVRVLDTAGMFAGVAVFADRLYYGVSASAHGNGFSNHLAGGVHLASMPLSDIKRTAAPLHEYISSPVMLNSTFGGYPTLGYRGGRLLLTAANAGDLVVKTWNAEMDTKTLDTVTFTAGETKQIDLATYLTGGLLGFGWTAGGIIDGTITLA